MANRVWTEAEDDALFRYLEAFLKSDEMGEMFDNMMERRKAASDFVDLLVQRGVVKFTPIERDT